MKEAQGATAAEAAKLAELQQRLDGIEAERAAAQDALAASRQEAATAQEQLSETRKQVGCCSGWRVCIGRKQHQLSWCCLTHSTLCPDTACRYSSGCVGDDCARSAR